MTRGVFGNRFWYAFDKPITVVYDPHTHRLANLEAFGDPLDAVAAFAESTALLPDEPGPDVRRRHRVRNLKLSLSGRCNLDCSYCFRHDGIPEISDESVARRAIDAMLNDFGSEAPDYSISFNMTSEPLLHADLLDSLLDYTAGLEKECGKTFHWYVLTNGTLSGPRVDAVMDKLIRRTGRLVVSIDGPPEVHDRQRHYPGGAGTHERLMAFIRRYRDRVEYLDAESVITDSYPHPWQVISYLLDNGFTKVMTRPVRGGRDDPEGLRRLMAGYDVLFTELDRRIRKRDFSLFTVLRHDHALRPLWRILPGYKAVNRCFWGLTHLVVDGSGTFYTCDGMIGRTKHRVGSIDEGLDWEAFHSDVSVGRREPCHSCWARYLCGGTCYLKGVLAADDPLVVDRDECTLNEYLAGKNLELAVAAMRRPGDLESLREAFIRF